LLHRSRAEVDRKIAGIVKAVEDGNYNQTLTKRLSALEVEKAEIDAKLVELGTPAKIEIHPNLSEVYRRKVAKLEQALATPDTQAEAGELLRSLIDRIELTPTGEQMKLKLCGDLGTHPVKAAAGTVAGATVQAAACWEGEDSSNGDLTELVALAAQRQDNGTYSGRQFGGGSDERGSG
jgi:hypothetical protein